MSYQDKQLKCKDCGQNFTFTAGEQDFFATKGFDAPSRCQDCRKKKKSRQKPVEDRSTNQFEDGQVHTITCSSCKKQIEVPFRPRNPVGILCAECFEAQQAKQKK